MRPYNVVLLALAVLSTACTASAQERAALTFHVSKSTGSDALDGLAPVRSGSHGPWRTLAKAATVKYGPGDKLLLKCGDSWYETLTMRGSGMVSAPITISSYGRGPRPLIRGAEAGVSPCVLLDKVAGVRLSGLEMTDGRNAVRLDVDSRIAKEYRGITIEDCFFRNIANPRFPNVARREASQHNDLRNMGWAIYVDGFGSPEGVVVKDLTVRRCVSLWCQGFYIHMGAVSAENVRFDSNSLVHNSYNSIYQTGAKRFSIVNSVLVYGYPWDFHPNGATQVLAGGLQGDASNPNEVVHNEFGWGGDYPGCPDGCAYDFEGATSGVVFRDNFMHNASGEPVLFMGSFEHKDLVFDRNTFRNNVRFSPRWDAYVTVTDSNTGNGSFTNNRFFVQPGKRAFIAKPPSFRFAGNDENAVGEFAAMPLVTRVEYAKGYRSYTLASKTRGAEIRYTTDGSLPDERSPKYDRAIMVTRSCAINAKAYKEGMNPSYVNCIAVDLADHAGEPPVSTRGDALDTLTVAFWARPSVDRPAAREAAAGDVAGQPFALRGDAGVAVAVGANGVSVFEAASGSPMCLLTDDVPLQGWRHIAVVIRDRQPSLYIDGVFEKAGCRSTVPVRDAFEAAAGVEEVRVYNRVLSDAEIQVLAASR